MTFWASRSSGTEISRRNGTSEKIGSVSKTRGIGVTLWLGLVCEKSEPSE